MSRVASFLALCVVMLSVAATYNIEAAEPSRNIPRLVALWPDSPSTAPPGGKAFSQRLRELGYNEGENIVVEGRWAEGQLDRLPGLAAELLRQRPDVVVTWGTPAAMATKNATSTVPIVAVGVGDPVGTGLTSSLAHPSGNLTGLSMGWSDGIVVKWLELIQEAVPAIRTLAIVANPDNAMNRGLVRQLEAAAARRDLRLVIMDVRHKGALDGAFKQARRRAKAVVLIPDSVINSDETLLTQLTAKYKMPVVYSASSLVHAGGLFSYGPDFSVHWKRAADYVDKVLKGTPPGDLPIEQPTKFELVVNLKTAKALGVTIPESILLRADEVIR